MPSKAKSPNKAKNSSRKPSSAVTVNERNQKIIVWVSIAVTVLAAAVLVWRLNTPSVDSVNQTVNLPESVDYRTNQTKGTGVVIASTKDIDKLSEAPDGFVEFIRSELSNQEISVACGSAPVIVVDVIDGHYATGSYSNCPNANVIWSDNSPTSDWETVDGSQSGIFSCEKLQEYNIEPAVLYTDECRSQDGNIVTYSTVYIAE